LTSRFGRRFVMKREEILKKLEYGIGYFPHDVVQEAIRWKDEILLSA